MAIIVGGILVLRWLQVDLLVATLIAGGFGLAGVLVMVFLSSRQGKMVHCLTWCPIGTIVNYTRFINPFRMRIDRETCTRCNLCTKTCRYDALHPSDIESGKPGITCTLCGDCVSSCHAGSIQYRFFKMKPEASRRLYLFLTVSAHAVFLAMARI
jgi:polyferredoxin